MRHALFAIILLLTILTLGLFVTSAQASWSVWVYQEATGQLIRVNNGAEVIGAIALQINDDDPQQMVISPDGSQLAYTLNDSQSIRVLNLNENSLVANIDLTDIGVVHNQDDWLYLSDVAFDAEGTHLVYTEMLGGLAWQIHVYDLANESIIHTLRHNDENAYHYRALHGGILPIVRGIAGDRVTFSVDMDYPVGIHSYHWFYTGDVLSETVAIHSDDSTFFPYTDDIVTTVHDYRFPTKNEDFRRAYNQRNALHAYSFEMGRFPIFFEPDLSFEHLWFVQGGERILAQAYFDEIRDVWLLIERDGSEIRRYPVAGEHVTSTPDGFVYTTPVNDETAIVTVDTRTESAGNTLWLQSGDWEILWAGSNQPESDFREWVSFEQAIEDPTGIVDRYATPTAAPPQRPFREVGMAIQIFVLDDGFLNLRDAPTVNSNVITLLESGSRGRIIGGPVEAEGFIWWEISVSTRTGWVVEELTDSIALIPPQIIPSITPTPTVTATP